MTVNSKNWFSLSSVDHRGTCGGFRQVIGVPEELDIERVIAQTISAIIRDEHIPGGAIGMNVGYGLFNNTKTHNFYFAKCADDVLRPETALEIAARLRDTPGKDMFARASRREGVDLESEVNNILKNRPETVAFLLVGGRREMFVEALVSLDSADRVLNRSNAEIYFPFPERPTEQSPIEGVTVDPT